MISVSEADALICQHIKSIQKKAERPLLEAAGFILAEDLVADRNQPPFHRVAMDGIAVSFEVLQAGQKSFKLEATSAAGSPQLKLHDQVHCIEVMTGGVLPEGCDVVIPFEHIEKVEDNYFIKSTDNYTSLQNVHLEGSDYKKGDLVLGKGHRLLGPQIAVAATVGKSLVKVFTPPKIAIINSGDELVDVNVEPLPHQIRRSNAYAIQAELKAFQFSDVQNFHLSDQKNILTEKLEEILNDFDVVLLSGGVSMGKFDNIPQALEDLKVKKVFHKVTQKPGKPMWFGVREQDNKPVFALPGNPVSALICFRRYVLPYLAKALNFELPAPLRVSLSEEVIFKKEMTLYQPVRLVKSEGSEAVQPIKGNGSGDFSSLALSHGFVELPADKTLFERGFVCNYFPWGAY